MKPQATVERFELHNVPVEELVADETIDDPARSSVQRLAEIVDRKLGPEDLDPVMAERGLLGDDDRSCSRAKPAGKGGASRVRDRGPAPAGNRSERIGWRRCRRRKVSGGELFDFRLDQRDAIRALIDQLVDARGLAELGRNRLRGDQRTPPGRTDRGWKENQNEAGPDFHRSSSLA